MHSRLSLASSLLLVSACAATAVDPVEVPAEATVDPVSAPRPSPGATPAAASPPPAPIRAAPVVIDASTAAEVRDWRARSLKPRARDLVAVEVSVLEQRFASMASTDPNRPQVARRLAEACVELAAASERAEPSAAAAARKKAIASYRLLVDSYPTSADKDEVLYDLAVEYERAADLTNARKTFYELIVKAPNSNYIPNAYLAFGELFFAEAERDSSKWDLAAQAYNEVLKYPPPKNGSFAYAGYKSAIVYREKGEAELAAAAFKKVIAAVDSYPNLAAAQKLREAARQGLRDLEPGN